MIGRSPLRAWLRELRRQEIAAAAARPLTFMEQYWWDVLGPPGQRLSDADIQEKYYRHRFRHHRPKEQPMSTVLSDADSQTLQTKVAALVTAQQKADAADAANNAAQSALSSAQSAASSASSALDVANTAVVQGEEDLESFVASLVAQANPTPAPAPDAPPAG